MSHQRTPVILMVCIATAAVAESGPVVSPDSSSQVFNATETARIRITVVDKSVLHSLPPNLSLEKRKQLELAINVATAQGAVDRSDFFKKTLASESVAAWTAARTSDFDAMFSRELLAEAPASIPAELHNRSKDYLATVMKEGILPSQIRQGQLLSSPLGSTATTTSFSRGVTSIRLSQLSRDSEDRERLMRRLDELGTKGLSEESTRLFVPDSPLLPTAPVVRYEFTIPASDLAFYRKTFRGQIDTLISPEMFQIDMENTEYANENSHDIPPQHLSYIAKNLANAYARDDAPVLVIVDDGIPSQHSFDITRAFFIESLPRMIKERGIDRRWITISPPPEFPAYSELESTQRTSSPRDSSSCAELDAPDCRLHARQISRALAVLDSLVPSDKAPPVRVIWVPLYNAQDGAFWIAEKISRIRYIDGLDLFRRKAVGARQATPENIADYYKELRALYHQLPSKYPNSSEFAKTPISYFESIANYFRIYSLVTGTPVIISLSWRIPSIIKDYSLPRSGEYRRLFVAAAGNPCKNSADCIGYTPNEAVGYYDFLQTASKSDRNFFLVANIDSNGQATCSTARLDPKKESSLAFPGKSGSSCGTSFSAPRMAWLIAARERYSTASQIENTAPWDWVEDLRTRLTYQRNMTECSGPTDMRCMLRLDRLFSGASPATRELEAPSFNEPQ